MSQTKIKYLGEFIEPATKQRYIVTETEHGDIHFRNMTNTGSNVMVCKSYFNRHLKKRVIK